MAASYYDGPAQNCPLKANESFTWKSTDQIYVWLEKKSGRNINKVYSSTVCVWRTRSCRSSNTTWSQTNIERTPADVFGRALVIETSVHLSESMGHGWVQHIIKRHQNVGCAVFHQSLWAGLLDWLRWCQQVQRWCWMSVMGWASSACPGFLLSPLALCCSHLMRANIWEWCCLWRILWCCRSETHSSDYHFESTLCI